MATYVTPGTPVPASPQALMEDDPPNCPEAFSNLLEEQKASNPVSFDLDVSNLAKKTPLLAPAPNPNTMTLMGHVCYAEKFLIKATTVVFAQGKFYRIPAEDFTNSLAPLTPLVFSTPTRWLAN